MQVTVVPLVSLCAHSLSDLQLTTKFHLSDWVILIASYNIRTLHDWHGNYSGFQPGAILHVLHQDILYRIPLLRLASDDIISLVGCNYLLHTSKEIHKVTGEERLNQTKPFADPRIMVVAVKNVWKNTTVQKNNVRCQHKRGIGTWNYIWRSWHGQTSRHLDPYLLRTRIEWRAIGRSWCAPVAQMIYCETYSTEKIVAKCVKRQRWLLTTEIAPRTLFNVKERHIQLTSTIVHLWT